MLDLHIIWLLGINIHFFSFAIMLHFCRKKKPRIQILDHSKLLGCSNCAWELTGYEQQCFSMPEYKSKMKWLENILEVKSWKHFASRGAACVLLESPQTAKHTKAIPSQTLLPPPPALSIAFDSSPVSTAPPSLGSIALCVILGRS